MKLCLLAVENTLNIPKNKLMKADFNEITRFLQFREIILFATVETLDKVIKIRGFKESL